MRCQNSPLNAPFEIYVLHSLKKKVLGVSETKMYAEKKRKRNHETKNNNLFSSEMYKTLFLKFLENIKKIMLLKNNKQI